MNYDLGSYINYINIDESLTIIVFSLSWSTSGTSSSGCSAFNLRYEGKQGRGADTAANALRLYISTGSGYSTSNEGSWRMGILGRT